MSARTDDEPWLHGLPRTGEGSSSSEAAPAVLTPAIPVLVATCVRAALAIGLVTGAGIWLLGWEPGSTVLEIAGMTLAVAVVLLVAERASRVPRGEQAPPPAGARITGPEPILAPADTLHVIGLAAVLTVIAWLLPWDGDGAWLVAWPVTAPALADLLTAACAARWERRHGRVLLCAPGVTFEARRLFASPPGG